MILPLAALTLSFIPCAQERDTEAERFFRDSVAPILEENCLQCHGSGKKLRGDLWLTRREGLLEGGSRGPVVNLEHPAESLLLAQISYRDEEFRMPPKGKLPDEEIAVLTKWIEDGAQWHPETIFEERSVVEPKRLTKGDGMEGWAYKRPQAHELPTVASIDWPLNGVDHFLLARQEAAGLQPAPEQDRSAWLRRVSYDLTGLPPTPEERTAFLADTDAGAHGRVVDRLLESPHYGERWARHWLDVARYAETNGFERDSDKPQIWRYRDWVVRAFNEDLPYDDFVRMQIAGDELDQVTHDSLLATGFLRLMQWDDEPAEGPVQARYDVLDDIVRTTSEGFLATTLGCARCHDHKGDPVQQTDYYSFMSFFEGLTNYRADGRLVPILSEEEQQAHAESLVRHKDELESSQAELQTLEAEFRQAFAERGKGTARTLLHNLRYRFYRDEFRDLAKFEDLRPEDVGALEGGKFDLSPATRNENYGFIFDGTLRIPEAGSWDVVLDADDGVRLTIGEQVVIEYDRLGGLGTPQRASIELAAGPHPVKLEFFQWVGGAALELSMAPSAANQWRYRFEEPPAGWEQADFDDESWREGRGGFGTQGTPRSEIGTVWNTEDVWLRHAFQWNPAEDLDPVLVGHHDDEMSVYVNGVLAVQTEGYIGDYRVFELSAEAKAALVPGENIIAIRCTQQWGGQYVHARLAPRAHTLAGGLANVAFGRYGLSASRRPDGGDLAQEIRTTGASVLGEKTAKRHAELKDRVRHLERNKPRPPRMANVATETGPRPALMRVHNRGSARAQGKQVPVAFPVCMDDAPAQIPEPAAGAKTSGRRRVLADWIASKDNPLTARVMVNRVWQHHFGLGLVPSSSDFGEFGERPSHPELLDWLAVWFMDNDWSVKQLHRLLLTSAAYRMNSSANADGLAADPTNTLLWHFRPRRLCAEEMRDSILWLTGKLNPTLGGKSIYSIMPAQAMATASRPGASWGKSSEDQLRRRSIYIKSKRSLLTPLLTAFDQADTDIACPLRFVTTSPSQALGLLNGEFSHLRASEFADRIREAAPKDRKGQVHEALQLALGREPQPADMRDALELWEQLISEHAMSEDQARTQICLYVINLSEFVYLD